MSFTQAEAAKEVRLAAKNLGMTFKAQPDTINDGQKAYHFVKRDSGVVLAENYAFWAAYEAVQNGDLERMLNDK